MGHAVNASLSMLATLLHPLASVNEQPLAKTHAQISSGDGNGGIFRLPPSCARFSPLPIQTPSLHAKRVPLQSAANESGADTVSARQRTISGAGYNSSGAAVSATAAAAAAAAASYLNADIDTRAFASGVLRRSGVLSNAGARVSGAEATQRARERVTGVTEKVSVFAGAALGGASSGTRSSAWPRPNAAAFVRCCTKAGEDRHGPQRRREGHSTTPDPLSSHIRCQWPV